MGWSLKSRGARSGSIQQTSPLEPLKRQRESQERIPMTLLKAKRNSWPLYSSPCRRMFTRLGFLVIYLKASSKTDPPLSLHTARVGSSVNYGRKSNREETSDALYRTLTHTHTRVFVCVYDCTFTCSIAVPGGWASVIVLKSFPLAKSHIVIWMSRQTGLAVTSLSSIHLLWRSCSIHCQMMLYVEDSFVYTHWLYATRWIVREH